MEKKQKQNDTIGSSPKRKGHLTYKKPTVRIYGDAAVLTRGGGDGPPDGETTTALVSG